METPQIKFLLKESMVVAVLNSVGSKQYRNLFVEENGVARDALEDGNLSCGAHVSGILAAFGLIDEGHATVESTLRHMLKAGWQEVAAGEEMQLLDVILWEPAVDADGSINKHIGFYVGSGKAVSNSSKKKSPKLHSAIKGQPRVEKVFRYDFEKDPAHNKKA